jgi:hypothetical protein
MRAKESGQSPLLLLDVIDILNKQKVPYAVIGAMAVSFYGVVRSSLDADALIRPQEGRAGLRALRSALIKAGMHVVVRQGGVDDPLTGIILIEDDHENHVDLLLGIKKADADLFQRVTRVPFQGETINMASAEDLICLKIYAGGVKDLADAQGILSVSEDIIDQKKLRRIARSFGKEVTRTLEEMM